MKAKCRAQLRRDDRGSTTISLVVLFPALIAFVFGGLQIAMYLHAKALAMQAARNGLQDARGVNGSAASGKTVAEQYLADHGGNDVMTGSSVSVSRSATDVTVTVTGTSFSIVPGLPGFQVKRTASGPVEQYTRPGGGP